MSERTDIILKSRFNFGKRSQLCDLISHPSTPQKPYTKSDSSTSGSHFNYKLNSCPTHDNDGRLGRVVVSLCWRAVVFIFFWRLQLNIITLSHIFIFLCGFDFRQNASSNQNIYRSDTNVRLLYYFIFVVWSPRGLTIVANYRDKV